MQKRMDLPNYVSNILSSLNDHGFQAFVVGGCVRDALLGIEPSDYDITTNALPDQVETIFSHTIPTGKKHGTITILTDTNMVEVTTYRIEADYQDHRHPNSVQFVDDLVQDLARRDFTINAMAYHPEVGLVDPFGGQSDLEKGLIRAVGDANKRFEEDALRMLRAHRFASRYHFQIEAKTLSAIQACTPYITSISVERIRSELTKILAYNPYEIKNMTQLLSHWMPELEACRTCTQTTPYHDTNVLHHILRACALLPTFDETLAYALLMHDLAKPACKTTKDGKDHFKGHPVLGYTIAKRICHDFKLTNVQKRTIPNLVLYHDEKCSDPLAFIAKMRIERGFDDAFMQQLLLVKYCDIMAHSAYGQRTIVKWKKLKEVYADCQEMRPMAITDLAINGRDVFLATNCEKAQIKPILKEILLDCFYHPQKNQSEDLLKELREKYR